MIPCARSHKADEDDEEQCEREPLQPPHRGTGLVATAPPRPETQDPGPAKPLDKEATERLLWGDGDDPLTEKEVEVLAMFREQRAIVRKTLFRFPTCNKNSITT